MDEQYMYNVYARRDGTEHWTIWMRTDSRELAEHNMSVIRELGWQYKMRMN